MILVDAGPLVAIVDSDDQHHASCLSALRELDEPIATIWPPITEAMYLLSDLPKGQEAVWQLMQNGSIKILSLDATDVPRIRELTHRYADLPIDFPDAALLRVAEREGVTKIFTVDRRDFSLYRLHDRIRPVLIP